MARSCAARAVSLCLAEAATFGSPAAGVAGAYEVVNGD